MSKVREEFGKPVVYKSKNLVILSGSLKPPKSKTIKYIVRMVFSSKSKISYKNLKYIEIRDGEKVFEAKFQNK